MESPRSLKALAAKVCIYIYDHGLTGYVTAAIEGALFLGVICTGLAIFFSPARLISSPFFAGAFIMIPDLIKLIIRGHRYRRDFRSENELS